MKIPKEPGYYWAKSGTYKWFNLLCRVSDEPPFMYIEAWHLVDDQLVRVKPSSITEWSDKIIKP